ncbi:MAG: tetratricopeptide repeat protein [Clostridia bacterium]
MSKYYLARCYLRGVGVDVNLKKAFALFKSAALDDGHILSHLFLIYCYQHGLGTRADYKVANKLMLEIETISERENGEYSGYINLYKGISYYHGVGIKKDIQKAASYFRQSKGLGSILYAPICEGDFSKADLLGLIYSRASLTEGFLIYTDEERG